MEALDGQRRLFGAEDPRVLTTLANLAGVYDGLGDTDRALATLLDALRTAEIDAGHGNDLAGAVQQHRSDVPGPRARRGAAPYLRRAAALALEQLGPDHPTTLSIQGNLAGLESDLGRSRSRRRALSGPRRGQSGVARPRGARHAGRALWLLEQPVVGRAFRGIGRGLRGALVGRRRRVRRRALAEGADAIVAGSSVARLWPS
jgi:hypothetical protein